MGNGTIRILIVEDVPDVARHLRGLVAEQRDLELLDIVRDGATALARLQELAPDVVVVDSLVRGPVQLHEVLAALRDRGIPAIVIKLEKMKGTADPGQGISAVLSMPFTGYQLMSAISRSVGAGSSGERSRGRIVAVAGAKGGVGRTRLAIELAASAVALGHTAALVDASLPYGDVRATLRVPADALSIVDLPTERIEAEDLERALVGHRSGVEVLLGPPRLEQAETVMPRDLEKVVGGLAVGFDVVVVDLPVVLDERTLAVLDAADRVLVATTDDPVAAGNTAKLLETLDRLGYPAGKVHLARLRSAAGSALPPGLAAVAPGEAAIHLVADPGPALDRAVANGESVVRLEPDGAYAAGVGSVVRALVGSPRPAAGAR